MLNRGPISSHVLRPHPFCPPVFQPNVMGIALVSRIPPSFLSAASFTSMLSSTFMQPLGPLLYSLQNDSAGVDFYCHMSGAAASVLHITNVPTSSRHREARAAALSTHHLCSLESGSSVCNEEPRHCFYSPFSLSQMFAELCFLFP